MERSAQEMYKKVIVLVLAFALVATLVFARGKEETETPTTASGEPQYGGTLTIVHSHISRGDPPSPDFAASGSNAPCRWLKPVQENPLIGDIEKFGPRGTGEFAFNLTFVPMKYIKGHLLESWEVTPEQTVWHVRPGIYWAAEDVKWMESRELVAQDVVEDLIYFKAGPGGKSFKKMAGDIYATDKYTVVIKTPGGFDVLLNYLVGYEDRAIVSPPEMIDAGAGQWENQVGTGPFMFKEYVVGSYMKFKKNPNYWKTTTIDGKEYKMPFVDELIIPIIPDESTQMAALRTGKLDMHQQPNVSHWKDLEKTAPELLSSSGAGWGRHLGFKTTKPPFNDVNVRRALMIGTNLKSFGDLHGIGPRPIHWYPMYPPYTKLEDLPAETRLLFDYNPELARKMLDDAGVPVGFKMDLYTRTEPEYEATAALLKDMWSKIGVEVNIVQLESVIWRAHLDKRTYTDSIVSTQAAANPAELFRYAPGMVFDIAQWKDEAFSKLRDKGAAELDQAKRDKIIEEAAIHIINEVPYLPLDLTPIKWFWWPWLKNYYGEWNIEDGGLYPIVPYIWIDQSMKKKMGY